MPGLTSSLNIGLSGLQAAQSALSVVGHNITNINTPGYTRQRAVLSANASQTFGSMQYGAGVNLTSIIGVRDRFVDLQIAQATSRKTGADVRYAGLETVSEAFSDSGESSLQGLLQGFFEGFQELAARPENGSVRTNLVGRAQALATGLKERYQLLAEQRAQADMAVGSLVEEVNTLTGQIAKLNERIATEVKPGADNDARDQRKVLADNLAELIGVQVFEDERGSLQITLDSGQGVLVNGNVAYTLTGTPDGANNNYLRLDLSLGSGTPIDVTSGIKEGKLGAYLDLRDHILPGYQADLDELAAGVVSRVNLAHRAGYALDGATTGVDFFLGSAFPNGANGLPTNVSAANDYYGMVNAMTVNAAVAGNPSLIAAADAAGASGNNGAAKAMAALATASGTVDTNGDGVGDAGPFSSVVSQLANQIGTEAQYQESRSTNDENLLTALQTQRDRASGVDLDEEATNLMAFQRGYQASARFVSVIDQLTDQLINQFGR